MVAVRFQCSAEASRTCRTGQWRQADRVPLYPIYPLWAIGAEAAGRGTAASVGATPGALPEEGVRHIPALEAFASLPDRGHSKG